ncbi:alpha/beta hydrolase [Paenarthrobacter sp. NPDC057355]|uniref:alpha/beta hydrolase n=1 Tax=Paenarthrobacter sp. NPDC057355 TaxID=3346105 RepID=UPI003642F058
MYQVDASALDGWPDPAALEFSATPLTENAQGVVNAVQSAASEWSAMADAYRAPEAPQLLSLFQPVTRKSEEIRTGLVVVYRALMAYADALRELNRRRGLLLDEIARFHGERDECETRAAFMETTGDVSFSVSGVAMASQAADLERRVGSLATEHEHAQEACARQIKRVYSVDPSVPVYYDGGALTEFKTEWTRYQLKGLEAKGGGGLETLLLLTSLTPGRLLDYGLAESDYLRSGLASPPAVSKVKEWWAGLSPEQQAALVVAAPGIIGSLNGIPYAVRAKANRVNLDAVYNDTRTSEADKVALRVIYDSLVPVENGPDAPARTIVSFTPDENGKPLVALAIGDLDTASNVTWNVPGMRTTVADGLESWTKSAQDLYNEQLRTFSEPAKAPTTAVVSWVGYDSPEAPPSGEVLSTELAKRGGAKLAAALDGFSETRAGIGENAVEPRLNLVAHSYGSTTASYALISISQEIATATFFGSAGIEWREIGSAADLHVAKDAAGQPEVYVTAASEDRVAPLGIMGSGLRGREGRLDPTGDWFGAKSFSSEGGYDPETGHLYTRTTGHDAKGWAASNSGDSIFAATSSHGYLDLNTESAHNIALTSTGRGEQIKQLLPLQRETQAGFGGMDFPAGRLVERNLTPDELTEELKEIDK